LYGFGARGDVWVTAATNWIDHMDLSLPGRFDRMTQIPASNESGMNVIRNKRQKVSMADFRCALAKLMKRDKSEPHGMFVRFFRICSGNS